ncbi:MAG TPA: XTP/dITP diphosphatase [Syntrophales bacterium]|nr:XTP/dITP diphosphatase [Syntrophales bacterium]HOL59076.1 XTP/dITP diphosphatase [Syntrophales bacterium]HPO35415.1 XTP/dITP diphosphatase [Syntrophales bacterium]
MKRVVLATANEGKIREIKMMLADLPLSIMTVKDFPEFPGVEEDGEDFFANAYKKARAVAEFTSLPAIADDSGLVVPALGGWPGVKSARFAGERATDGENIEKLLELMKDLPEGERKAYFTCVVVYCEPAGKYESFTGKWEGLIIREERGKGGFGYDPIFFVPALGRTAAELAPEEKNKYSHRGQALKALKEHLSKSLKFVESGRSAAW